MDDSELERTPNPFSAFAESRDQSKRHFASTAKLLLLAIGLFCIVTAAQAYLQRARLAELLNDFSGRSTAEKLQQLQELQASGVDGLPGVVAALADDKPDVSVMASEILVGLNRQWMTLPPDQMQHRRSVYVNELVKVSNELSDPSDARLHRVQDLARLAARDLIDWGYGQDDPVYSQLMQVLASDRDTPASDPSVSAGASRSAGPEQPLPIDLVHSAGASWTDWPPTTSTPSLYRRSVATLEPMDESAVVLQQWEGDRSSRETETRLLKPRFRATPSLLEQSRQRLGGEPRSTDYWIDQLQNGSPFVRLGAVTELIRRDDQRALDALRSHLDHESDDRIRQQITQHVSP